ncbi:MAG: hypothetical protein AB8G96_10315 [Phycisphaerales bacterium]
MSDANPTTADVAAQASSNSDASPAWVTDPGRMAEHERWLMELTGTPTAAGHEDRVIAWIEAWAADHGAELHPDPHGNLRLVRRGHAPAAEPAAEQADRLRPLIFQAHLDHPAFVVEDRADDGSLDLTFRGGVRDPYFAGTRIVVITPAGDRHGAKVTASEALEPLRRGRAELDDPSIDVPPGSIAVWDLPAPAIDDGILRAPAVDDLAGVAAALAAFDVIGRRDVARPVEVFLTRAEEVGFVGTTAACRDRTLPSDAEIVTLETSRSFADSPIGGGPIVRVGDRVSSFDIGLTAVASEVGKALAKEHADFAWQRKLMAGGACEATVYVRCGYAATCLCLPLGNYHNMSELDRIEAESPDTATIDSEFIAVSDYHGLVRMLVGIAEHPPGDDPVMKMIDRRFEQVGWILGR